MSVPSSFGYNPRVLRIVYSTENFKFEVTFHIRTIHVLTSIDWDASCCVTWTSSLFATHVSDPIWFSTTNIPNHGKTASVTQFYSS